MAWPSTFLNLQTNVIARLNLDATADLSTVKDAINQAYGQVYIETEASQTSTTKTLTAGSGSVDLSTISGAVRFKSFYISSGGVTYAPLMKITLDQLLRRRISTGGVSVATGTATHYAVNGMNDMQLWPTPAAADVMTVFYAAQPTALSADSDVPAIPEPYATRCLTFGAMAELADLANDPSGDDYQQKFDSWVMKFRQHLNRRKGGQPGQFEFMPDSGFPLHDPSTVLSGWGS